MTSTTMEELRAGPAKQQQNQLVALSGFLDKMKGQIARALPRHLNADRMSRLALTAFSTTPALRECTPQSIAGSLMTAAQLGLEPNVGGQGYLVPYKDRRRGVTLCQFIPGWRGLVDLANRSGRCSVWTGVARMGDEFDYQLGDAPFVRHKPGEEDEGSPFTHVYACGRVRDASMAVIEVWTRAKVERHLAKYNKVGDSHYARESEHNFEQYGRKVALLQVLKYMPSSIELEKAITVAEATDTHQDFVIEADFARVVPDEATGEVPPPPPAPPAPAPRTRTRKEPPAAAHAPAPAAPVQPAADAGPAVTYAQLADAINTAPDREAADQVLDRGRSLPDVQREELARLYELRFTD
jgi:recombination protein RecT